MWINLRVCVEIFMGRWWCISFGVGGGAFLLDFLVNVD